MIRLIDIHRSETIILIFTLRLLNYSILYNMAWFVFRMLLVMSCMHSYQM